MNNIQRIALLLIAIAFITGCTMNNGARGDAGDRNDTRVQNFDNNPANDTDDRIIQNDDNNRNNMDDSQMRVAAEAQRKVEALTEVRRANVIVTNRNAYVGVVLTDDSDGEVRKDIENKISDQVKSTDNKIQNVYISSNPDFVKRMREYGDDLENGRPIRGLFDEFNEMVQRVFPTER